ncbi:hypothetical protein [Gelidibacter sp.]|uniref:hypothetical protein n=1 Tax=Gelidibacter sp. TaxID=2018083 RepID=UPI003266F713
MKKTIYIIILVTAFFSCKNKEESTDSAKTAKDPAQLFYNGDILTMHSEKPSYAEAIVEENGKIVFV